MLLATKYRVCVTFLLLFHICLFADSEFCKAAATRTAKSANNRNDCNAHKPRLTLAVTEQQYYNMQYTIINK